MNIALDLLIFVVKLWKDLPSMSEILCKLKEQLVPQIMPADSWHPDLASKLQNLTELMSSIETEVVRSHTVPQRKKEIKILRLYDPDLDENFDPLVKKRNNDVSREKQEMAKLNHKLKREKKAAKKDLRADAAFLAKQKAKEKREKDDERTRKTKAILGGLGGQEGEYRQMQRQKKKKKF